eukprot:COSAG02_NODE_56_length_43700_cov_33.650765_13_plen_107_part_00
MLATALLLPGGHLGVLGGGAVGADGSGESVLAPSTVPDAADGSRWGLVTGEHAHLLRPCLNPAPSERVCAGGPKCLRTSDAFTESTADPSKNSLLLVKASDKSYEQ